MKIWPEFPRNLTLYFHWGDSSAFIDPVIQWLYNCHESWELSVFVFLIITYRSHQSLSFTEPSSFTAPPAVAGTGEQLNKYVLNEEWQCKICGEAGKNTHTFSRAFHWASDFNPPRNTCEAQKWMGSSKFGESVHEATAEVWRMSTIGHQSVNHWLSIVCVVSTTICRHMDVPFPPLLSSLVFWEFSSQESSLLKRVCWVKRINLKKKKKKRINSILTQ